MTHKSRYSTIALLLAPITLAMPGQLAAQLPEATGEDITVYGTPPADLSGLPEGPQIEGFISARKGEQIQVTSPNGSRTVVLIGEATKIRARKGPFGINRTRLGPDSLLTGLPVAVKTVEWGGGLVASQVRFKNSDLKTAKMIQSGTAQGFAEQTAATDALRTRIGDIDQYNIKATTSVNFDSGKSALSSQGKTDLCSTAYQAEALQNSLLLVVGYTDSTGSQELNQRLSEQRARNVVNYLQQACGWKPYRMLTPTGMAMADPLASNDTEEGKARNRRVEVNILVSKALDGL